MSLIAVEDILNEYAKRGRGTVKPGADRLQRLFGGAIPQPFQVILIAGTNGKGSTAWCLSHCLQASGKKVGLYTSPHLLRATERIRFDGKSISQEGLLDCLQKAHALAQKNLRDASYFEVFTAAAILAFQGKVDIGLFEVGLGGRLDSTNALSPDMSLVTALGYDHAEFLGTQPEGIAFEKGCVSRKAKPCLYLKPNETAFLSGLHQAFSLTGCDAEAVDGKDLEGLQNTTSQSQSLWLKSSAQALALAYKATQVICNGFPEAAWQSAIRALEASPWPGRLQYLMWNGKSIIFDGGHNLCGLRYGAGMLKRHLDVTQIRVITGFFADKNWKSMLNFLNQTYSKVSVCQLSAERSLVAQVHSGLRMAPLRKTLEEQLATLRPGETLLVTGSLSIVGEAMEILGIEL